MSNEITMSVSISCNKPASMTAAISRSMLNQLRNMNSDFNSYGQVVLSSNSSNAVALPLGGLAPSTSIASSTNPPHFGWFANLDASNYLRVVDLNVGSSAMIAQLGPGDVGLIPLYANCKPGAWGETGSPILEFFIMGY